MTDRARFIRTIRRALRSAPRPVFLLPLELVALGGPSTIDQLYLARDNPDGIAVSNRRRGLVAYPVAGIWMLQRK